MSTQHFPRVDGFTIRRVIGSGGFSTVYEATQDDIGSTVALKVLNVSVHDEAGTRRLVREYRSMGRLRDQPGIVHVYGTSRTSEGHAVIIMAFLPGGSLHDRIRDRGPLPSAEIVRIADELAGALAAAHALGIQHRDIKPENVLFDARGNAALSDFGLATIEGISDASTTAASLSPPHAPPERFLNAASPDPVAGDIYSLASTLATCITGRPPFGTSQDGGIAALILRITGDEPPALDRQDLPRGLTRTITAGLNKDPAARPMDVRTFQVPDADDAHRSGTTRQSRDTPIGTRTQADESRSSEDHSSTRAVRVDNGATRLLVSSHDSTRTPRPWSARMSLALLIGLLTSEAVFTALAMTGRIGRAEKLQSLAQWGVGWLRVGDIWNPLMYLWVVATTVTCGALLALWKSASRAHRQPRGGLIDLASPQWFGLGVIAVIQAVSGVASIALFGGPVPPLRGGTFGMLYAFGAFGPFLFPIVAAGLLVTLYPAQARQQFARTLTWWLLVAADLAFTVPLAVLTFRQRWSPVAEWFLHQGIGWWLLVGAAALIALHTVEIREEEHP